MMTPTNAAPLTSSTVFNPLQHPIIFTEPERKPGDSAWAEHTPFAMFLTELLRPRVFVELGTYAGASYCAFCQASQILNVQMECSAVDTWEGDLHAGNYPADVLKDLKIHHDPRYGKFSKLLQMTFDEALKQMPDDSIDLLHIDGLHTYEAVKHDYDTWLPKMSERGVIIFHDTAVVERDFGVKAFWEEVQKDHLHFEFKHGHGLGVLGVGRDLPAPFVEFMELATQSPDLMRLFFSRYGRIMSLQGDLEITHERANKDIMLLYSSRSWQMAEKARKILRIFKKK